MLGGRVLARSLSTTARRLTAQTAANTAAEKTATAAASAQAAAAPLKPVRRVGALRGGFTGFLVGVTVTGGAAYYYLLDEYHSGQRAILADVIVLRESLVELNAQIAKLKEETGPKE